MIRCSHLVNLGEIFNLFQREVVVAGAEQVLEDDVGVLAISSIGVVVGDVAAKGSQVQVQSLLALPLLLHSSRNDFKEFAMETYRKLPSVGIHPGAYKAAMECGKQIGTVFSDSSELETALNSVTPGGGNTLLHLAASVRNIECIRELLKCKPLLVSQTNSQGNTALHLAAQRGFSDVVELILKENESGVDAANDLGETALFKACESGDSKTVEQLLKALWASLYKRTKDNRTCLNVAINRGDSDVVKHILQSYREDSAEIISETYNHGDTALHVAVGRNYLHIITQLIEFEPQLCYCLNDNHETPLLMAAKLGHLEAVKELIKWRPDAVEIPNSYGMNALHLAAQVSQLRIVDYLNETVFLLDLVNKGLEEPPEEKPMQSEENAVPAKKKDPFSKISKGDTPLHIAARNKCFHMVDSLLRIPGINKAAVNKEGLTALDIAREITEYHESHKIIAMLSSYPSKCRPFLYSAPKVTAEKQKAAIKLLDETFDARRNTELVVAVLLATMSFTAAFTVPGGFQTEREKVKTEKMLGSPVLIGFESFKVFLIFDCLAFFLSLFALLVWQMSTPLTTENKVFIEDGEIQCLERCMSFYV
ncbi:hypothetical protein SUGI_0696220 [Cryptomeria japonica]|nr:hypothetical protein SUGI_0696220 [Cryptomeria japonica]